MQGAWRAVISLTDVERAFADLKDVLDMRPIDHRSDLRVQAHIFVAALAFLLTQGRAQYTGKGHLMTKAHQRERKSKRRQAEFVTDEEQRLLEIEDMRLVVKFGEKRRYSDSEHEAIYQELVEAGLNHEAMRDPDAIEAVYKNLNAANEAEAARLSLQLSRQPYLNHVDGILPLLHLVAQKSGKCRQPPGGTNPGG